MLICLCFALACEGRGTLSSPRIDARGPLPSPSSSRAREPASTGREPAPPPLVRCLRGGRTGPPQSLVTRGEEALRRGDAPRALACAEEALRASPRLLSGLSCRAAALVGLGRLEEARTAYARALAVDPSDAEVLYGAADLHVARLDGDRDTVELGLEYALRGLARARLSDPELTADLALVAASAENDLGESAEALEHAGEALRVRPGSTDGLYEKGVALYELCRFGEARSALERVLELQPDDPWTLYQLSLVAERTGDARRAERLARRATALAPEEFPPALELPEGAFDRELRKAVAALPPAEQQALSALPVEVADVPALDDLTAVEPPLSPSILGLYRGPSEGEPCLPQDGPRCRSIVFYRRNLARFARTPGELEEQVRVTLLHELGHFHGESDDELRARGLE